MNAPFEYYPMSRDEFKEFRKNSAERMADHVAEMFDYSIDNFPGLEPVPWRQQLEFFRMQGQDYWEQLGATNPRLLKATLLHYGSLYRREQRG